MKGIKGGNNNTKKVEPGVTLRISKRIICIIREMKLTSEGSTSVTAEEVARQLLLLIDLG